MNEKHTDIKVSDILKFKDIHVNKLSCIYLGHWADLVPLILQWAVDIHLSRVIPGSEVRERFRHITLMYLIALSLSILA